MHADLVTAQKEASRVPYVEVDVGNRVASLVRLVWASAWDEAADDDEHDAVQDADYLHRVRVRAGAPQYERDAGSGWAGLNAQTDSTYICVDAINDTRVIIFYNRGTSIYFRESTDQGENFGAETLAVAVGAAVNALACVYKDSGGDLVLFYANVAALTAARRDAGSFDTPVAHGTTFASVNGITAVYFGDFNVALTGTENTSTDPHLWTTVFGDGYVVAVDTWAAEWVLEEAAAASNVSFVAPSMVLSDTHRLFFVEKYTGTTAYSEVRMTWLQSAVAFSGNSWREPVPFEHVASEKGVAAAGYDATYDYLSRPEEVWRAPYAAPYTDLTGDVVAMSMEMRGRRGRVKVTLRNDDARFSDLPNGSYSVITRGAELRVSLGYNTSSGDREAGGLEFRIDGWGYTSEGGKGMLEIYASDGWAQIEGWRARRQHRWAAASLTVGQILWFVLGRAGLKFASLGSSTTATNLKPEFTIHAGEDGLRVIERLMAMLPDSLWVVGESVYIIETEAADSSDYSYGGEHVISRARFVEAGPEVNRAQVFGPAVFEEDVDWGEVEKWFDRVGQVFDVNMSTAALAAQRATDTLRQAELETARGELVSPPNCGQAVGDVIDVTDSHLVMSSEKFRVLGVEYKFERGRRAKYEQRLLLGSV